MGSRFAAPPYWRIVGSVFIGMLGFGAVIPVLPIHLKEQLFTSNWLTGLLIGIASAAALGGRLFAGRVADRKGRRNAFAIGLGFCGLAGILYLPVFGIWGLAAGRIVHGVGEGFFLTASVAWAVDLAAPDRRAQALGFFASGVWGGLSVGPLIGQVLGSWSRVSWSLTFSSFLVMVVLFFTKEAERPAVQNVKGELVPRAAWLPGVILGLSNVAYAAMSGFLILLLRSRGFDGGPAFAAFALSVLFTRTAFGSLPDRIGPRRTLFLGFVLLGVGLTSIAAVNSFPVTVIASAIVGLGYAFPWPSLAVVVVRNAGEDQRGAALGALTAFYDLFVALGALLAGALATRFGYIAAFWLAFASVLCAATVAWLTRIGEDETRALLCPEQSASLTEDAAIT